MMGEDMNQAENRFYRESSWQPIDTAPNGHYKTIANPKGDRQVFVPEWCFVMNKGIRHWTYRTEGGRWNGLTENEIGDCWHPAPTPPDNQARESVRDDK